MLAISDNSEEERADGDFDNLQDIRQTSYQILMSDYNGLSIRSYSDHLINQDLSKLETIFSQNLVRSTFNYYLMRVD